MRTVIPNELAGASLLGVHNWIKSKVALSNPGGSPDYKLSDMQGRRITLSDVARNPGKEVMIEVETIQGVRSNPAGSMAAVPGLEFGYPVTVRSGNDLTELLPDEIDPRMAQRVVAEQGLRRGLHTLNRMLISKYDSRITSPTTAALLQMGEIVKRNPADRTPFTQRTPLIYSPEKALATWLAENSGADIEAKDVKAQKYTQVFDAKIAARYGLNTQDIDKFARDVLMDYLFSASANRALVRMLISRNVNGIKQDRQTIHKLLAMFPQQPQAFYSGAQRVFVAHPAFIYPAYAETLLSERDMKSIVNFARGYPGNMGREGSLPGIGKLVRSGFGNTAFGRLREFLTFGLLPIRITSKNSKDSTVRVDRNFERRPPIEFLVEHLRTDPRSVARANFRPLYFFSDIGGFYPAPPPKWPREIVFAIMDTFLENLPYIVNMEDPSQMNLTPTRMAYLAEPTEEYVFDTPSKSGFKMKADKFLELKRKIEGLLNDAVAEQVYDAMDALLKDAAPPADAASKRIYLSSVLLPIMEAAENDAAGATLGMSQELTFDAGQGKSVLEMAYDVASIAQEKYNYNMRGDDFKFVMAMLHYSFEAVQTKTGQGTFDLTKDSVNRVLKSFVGSTREKEFEKLQKQIFDSNIHDDVKAGYVQSSILAYLLDIDREIEYELDKPMTPEAKEALLDEIKEDMRVLVDTLNNMSMSAGMEMAVAGVLTTISRRIEKAA